MKLIRSTRAAVAILLATAMIFSSILLEPLQASAAGAAAPGAPTSVTAVGVGNEIDVHWDAPAPSADTGVPEVAAYEIDWKLSSDVLYGTPSVTDSVVRDFEILIFTPGFYDVRIRSVAQGCTTDACRSVAVVETSVLIQDLFAAPRIPTNLTAVGNAASISVAWVAPVVVTNDVPVAAYEIDWKLSSAVLYGTPSLFEIAGDPYLYYEIPTLTTGFYDVRVRAVAPGCITAACRSVGVVIRPVEVGGSAVVAANPSVSFQKQTGQEFSRDPNLASNYLVWTDLEDSGDLSFSLQVGPGVTWADVRLYPFDETTHSLLINSLEENYDLRATSSVGGLLHIASLCDNDACPSVFKFEISTFKDPDGEVIDAIENIYLVRKPDPQTYILTYARDASATLPADDPRWIQVVDSSSIGVENTSWVTKVDPNVFWGQPIHDKYANGKYFGGWCTEAAPTDMEYDCSDPQETTFSVYRDRVIYPFWIDDLNPTSISAFDQRFTSEDWEFDHRNRSIYLTLEQANTEPDGIIIIEGPMGVEYDTDFTEEDFEVLGCSDTACLYELTEEIFAGGEELDGYTIFLIVTTDQTATSDVAFDATPGDLPQLVQERFGPLENQVVGWYPVPVVPDRSLAFTNKDRWKDSITESNWVAFFPVLGPDTTLRLDWGFGPFISAPASVTIFYLDSNVATVRAWCACAPSSVLWALIGTDDFQISESGVISTVDPQLRAAEYTFSIVAGDNENVRVGPPVQMTVTVVERSHVGSSENTSLPPTNQTGVGQELPKAGSKLQPELISKVSRSKLAVGGTAQFSVTGGEPGATSFFESTTTRICSINARGLVTAKSTGVCLIAATATAKDPVFATANAPLTRIVVLGPGLINDAKVTEVKGQVLIKASLLKSLAGKSVKLAIEVKRGGKLVLVPMRSEVLSKSATATFKSFAKPRPGTRVVLLIGGRAVYASTL